MTNSAEYGWSDAFVPMSGVPAAWRLAPGPDEFLVRELTASALPHRQWPSSPLGPAVEAWAFLDGGVHHVSGFGGGLDTGVRVFGWQTMRWVSYGLRLDPPEVALPGEDDVPPFGDLETRLHVGDAEDLQRRADLLSAVDDAGSLRQFVQRTFGDAGLSYRSGPNHPAAGAWGRLGFTTAAAALLEQQFGPDEAAQLARQRFPELSRGEGDGIGFRMSLKSELMGYEVDVAQALLGGDPSSPSSTGTATSLPINESVGETAASTRPSLAEALAARFEEDEDFDPDEIDGGTLVSLWWDNDTGMPSWSGGVDLIVLRDGTAVMVHRGDSEGGVEPVDLPSLDHPRAEAIASWLAGDFHSGFAAIDLEPLDPNHTLSAEARDEWDEAMGASNSYVSMNVGALEPAVRAALGRDDVYARVRDALTEPDSPEGALLLMAIQAAGDGGSYTVPGVGRVGGPRAVAGRLPNRPASTSTNHCPPLDLGRCVRHRWSTRLIAGPGRADSALPNRPLCHALHVDRLPVSDPAATVVVAHE